MAGFDQGQRDRLLRLVARTGEDFPLGGEVSSGCLTLGTDMLTPALREILEHICASEAALASRIEDLESRVKLLEAHEHASLDIRLLKVRVETDNAASQTSTSEDFRIPFFWHAKSSRWWSVDSILFEHSRNTTNYTGALRISSNAIIPTASSQYVGQHIAGDAALVGVTGACHNLGADPVNDQELDIYINGSLSTTIRWPDGAIRISHFWPLENAKDYDASHATAGHYLFLSATTPATSPNPLDRPRFQTFWRYYRDDVPPPSEVPIDAFSL